MVIHMEESESPSNVLSREGIETVETKKASWTLKDNYPMLSAQ